jgi:hypothetical protein
MLIGTNVLFNLTTFTTPTSALNVQNLENKAEVVTNLVRPFDYFMVVPGGLEFSSIVNDVPSTPTPYAGSPGCVCLWGDNMTPSTAYFRVHVTAKWHLRGRQ